MPKDRTITAMHAHFTSTPRSGRKGGAINRSLPQRVGNVAIGQIGRKIGDHRIHLVNQFAVAVGIAVEGETVKQQETEKPEVACEGVRQPPIVSCVVSLGF